MRTINNLIALICLSALIASCDVFDDDDDKGSTGGSGENTATTTASTDTSVTASGKIYLDAFDDFSCSSNWANRDGARGLKAHSGSGSCSASFPGKPGKYRITVRIQTEFDGKSPYKVSVNGQTIHSGNYPLSSSLYCDCPKDDWRKVCPDKNVTIDCGTVALNTGDKIGFWGQDHYPCGGNNGSYAKWHGMTFTLVN